MKNNKLKLYLSIFKFTFYISAFTFGGGYVVIPMMRKYFVKNLGLLTEEELLNIAAIAQSTPGAIAVNTSVLVGYRISGIGGAIVSCIGTILPPLFILSIISFFYTSFKNNRIISAALKGMEVGVAAIILDLTVDMTMNVVRSKKILLSALILISFVAHFIFNINILFIIIFSSILCILQTYINFSKGETNNG